MSTRMGGNKLSEVGICAHLNIFFEDNQLKTYKDQLSDMNNVIEKEENILLPTQMCFNSFMKDNLKGKGRKREQWLKLFSKYIDIYYQNT